MVTSRRSGVSRLHPAIKAEGEALRTFTKLVTLLGLTWDHKVDGWR
jgi:phage terminase small subunit